MWKAIIIFASLTFRTKKIRATDAHIPPKLIVNCVALSDTLYIDEQGPGRDVRTSSCSPA